MAPLLGRETYRFAWAYPATLSPQRFKRPYNESKPQSWHAPKSSARSQAGRHAQRPPRVCSWSCLRIDVTCVENLAGAQSHAEAVPLLLEIGELYAIEKNANERELTDGQRGCLRHAKARPLLKNLQRMFADAQKCALPRSALGEAARYATNQ